MFANLLQTCLGQGALRLEPVRKCCGPCSELGIRRFEILPCQHQDLFCGCQSSTPCLRLVVQLNRLGERILHSRLLTGIRSQKQLLSTRQRCIPAAEVEQHPVQRQVATARLPCPAPRFACTLHMALSFTGAKLAIQTWQVCRSPDSHLRGLDLRLGPRPPNRWIVAKNAFDRLNQRHGIG
ncbi:hypothetical protein D3C84_852050 [compost metagenome]